MHPQSGKKKNALDIRIRQGSVVELAAAALGWLSYDMIEHQVFIWWLILWVKLVRKGMVRVEVYSSWEGVLCK